MMGDPTKFDELIAQAWQVYDTVGKLLTNVTDAQQKQRFQGKHQQLAAEIWDVERSAGDDRAVR